MATTRAKARAKAPADSQEVKLDVQCVTLKKRTIFPDSEGKAVVSTEELAQLKAMNLA